MSEDDFRSEWGERAGIVGCFAIVGAALLWFAGIPLLGTLIDYWGWGPQLIAVTALVVVCVAALGIGVAWIFWGGRR